MNDDIQFGDVRQSQPESGLRPDQDAHYATAMVGDLEPDDLQIFVDLDVMRDMEAHASSNTRVELGGVMLGHQRLDRDGKPFVWISECLRAEHYQATKGSFKFTHETWSQITRQRADYDASLAMVGWYHTHPGWSVFLSGMDLFICDHFFNQPLDVALVIDPCQQNRGWFQWTTDEPRKTRSTGGFVLVTSRHRQQELDYFSGLYNREPTMNLDPRYSTGAPVSGAPQVHLLESRKSALDLAVLAFLAIQLVLLAILVWQLTDRGRSAPDAAQLTSQVAQLESQNLQSAREQVYREVLSSLSASQGADPKIAEQYAIAEVERQQLKANLEGQYALVDKLVAERNSVQDELSLAASRQESLAGQLSQTRQQLTQTRQQLKQETADSAGSGWPSWLPGAWELAGLFLALVASGLTGYWLRGSTVGHQATARKRGPVDSPANPASAGSVQKSESGAMLIQDET